MECISVKKNLKLLHETWKSLVKPVLELEHMISAPFAAIVYFEMVEPKSLLFGEIVQLLH